MNKQSYTDNLLDERHQQIMETLNQIEQQQEKFNSRIRWAERWIYTAFGAIGVLGAEVFGDLIKNLLI